MPSVMTSPPPVNTPLADVQRILRRGIAVNEAMHELAKWDCERRGITYESFKLLPIDDRATYRIVTERMLAKFEARLLDRDDEDRETVRAAQRQALVQMERQMAALQAAQRGHALGAWSQVAGRFDETAACHRCARVACLVVCYAPDLVVERTGSALAEGCLVAAEEA